MFPIVLPIEPAKITQKNIKLPVLIKYPVMIYRSWDDGKFAIPFVSMSAKIAKYEKDKMRECRSIQPLYSTGTWYHLSMKEWYEEQMSKVKLFFNDYGKVTTSVSLIILCVGLIYFIILISVPQKLKVSFLDIGQGDAILIITPSGKKMLIDGGPTNKILERLNKKMSYFDNDIDVMIETHPDADHVTGLIPVLEKYNVHTIVSSPVDGHTGVFDDLQKHIDDEQAQMHVAQSGDVIDFGDGVVANVLYPPKNYVAKKNDTNDASVSVEIKYRSESFLLTGDLPTPEESKLIIAGLDKNITVYKAGHHGSKYSSGEQLLTFIKPEYAIISAGINNKYGHPNIETIERLEKYSKEIISTINRGTISFITDGKMIEVETEK